MNEFYAIFQRLQKAGLIPKTATPAVYRIFWQAAKGALAALLLIVSASAETLVWDANPATDSVAYYNVYSSANAVTWTTNRATTPSMAFPNLVSGVTYRFYVTAVNTSQVESAGSEIVVYWKPQPIPAINVVTRTIAGYSPSTRTWTDYRVFWQPIDLSAYRATNYWFTVQSISGNQVFNTGVTNFFTFPTLALGDYTFSVNATNTLGGSPNGTVLQQSGRPPGNPRSILMQP